MNLDIEEWKPFVIANLFDLYDINGITKEEIEDNPGSFAAIQSYLLRPLSGMSAKLNIRLLARN